MHKDYHKDYMEDFRRSLGIEIAGMGGMDAVQHVVRRCGFEIKSSHRARTASEYLTFVHPGPRARSTWSVRISDHSGEWADFMIEPGELTLEECLRGIISAARRTHLI